MAVRKLSDIIIDENIKHIDLLKIDTEGHEYNCFLGLFDNGFKPPIRYIQIESHQDDMYKNKSKDSLIPKLLNDNGFIEINRIKHGFGDFYEIIYRNTNYN